MKKSIVTYETFHGSAKKAATAIAEKLGCRAVNIDTPFEVEKEGLAEVDNVIICFNFRGPYTAQFTKLWLNRVSKEFAEKNVFLVGEGLFSEKEFPVVAEEIHKMIPCRNFSRFFIKGQLRMATLSPEEQALLGKFMEITGMKLQDMGEFDAARAAEVADEIAATIEADDYVPAPAAPEAVKTGKRWKCPMCGYIFVGEEPPERCPLCGVPGDQFILLED